MITPVSTRYAGARVTRLVNRDEILRAIRSAVEDTTGQTYVFYIEAPGGTGKTFLAREVLRRCREGEWPTLDLAAAREEIDLYHQGARSREGFMDTVVKVLDVGPNAFQAYRKQHEHLQEVKYDLRGAINELKKEEKILVETFLAGCADLAKKKRIIVAVDTVERLVYESDRVQEALGLGEDEFTMRRWLLGEWLPQMPNAVILVSGRPREDKRFAAEIADVAQEHPEIVFSAPELGNFCETDTLTYFEAVEETARADENLDAQKKLHAISKERRKVIHHLTGGHPITLALVIDYYLATGDLLPEVKMSLETVQSCSDGELVQVRQKIRADVARQFLEIGRPADEAIRALAWAPKGMDAALLSRVAGMKYQEADEVLHALADPHRGLSFVKIRPADKKAFLHDEMYALMKEHALALFPEARAEEVYDDILAYYDEQIKAQREQVRQLRERRREERVTSDGRIVLAAGVTTPVDPKVFTVALDRWDELEIERLYYQLRSNPRKGFEAYSEQAMAAVTANDTRLDMSLRDEMLLFTREIFGEGKPKAGELRRDDVERHAATLWAWRNVYAANPRQARAIINYLREAAGLVTRGADLTETELDIVEGWAAAFLGEDLEKAETQLRAAIDMLLCLETGSDFEHRRKDLLLARAYNILGYLLRVQGRFRSACKAYRPALPLWRKLELEADHAETLNNLAWANAEAGNLGRAMRRCQDGMELREKIGARYLVALSYNTLGLIEIRIDQPHRGRVHCERALAIFRELGVERGAGLAWTALAEAHRRCAAAPRVYLVEEKVDQLRLAWTFATQAVEVFRGVPERLRLVEALNELGCVCRDWLRLRPEYEDEADPSVEELTHTGTGALQEAADLAAGAFPYRSMDALVNLAWLYFYIHEPELVIDTLGRAEEYVGEEYRLSRPLGKPSIQDPVAFLWVPLGKSHLLQGMLALRQYKELPKVPDSVRDKELWGQVAKHFTLALAYNEQYADDSRDMRRAKDAMYEALRGANMHEIVALYDGVKVTAKMYGMDYKKAKKGRRAEPRMRNFLEEYFGSLEEVRGGMS